MADCDICCTNYNKRKNKKVTCVNCDKTCCSACFGTFLLDGTSLEPSCMFCRKQLHMDFVREHMTQVFVNKYTDFRHDIVFSRHKSLLPATQEAIEQEKLKANARVAIKQINVDVATHTAYIKKNKLNKEKKTEVKRLRKVVKTLKDEQAELLYFIRGFGLRRPQTAQAVEPKKHAVKKCPTDSCRGFINSSWVCGLCDTQFCPECHDKKEGEHHVCVPDTLATIKLLKDTTKPCPKCGVAVIKVDGCDQVFCVVPECRTPFSWRSGKIDTSGHIHSPDYYRFLRDHNQVVPRTDAPAVCGRRMQVLPGFYTIYTRLRNQPGLWALHHQQVVHVQGALCGRIFPGDLGDFDGEVYRRRYLRNDISETKWKDLLKRAIKNREHRYEIGKIYRLYLEVMTDYFHQLLDDGDLAKFEENANQFFKFTNDSIIKINTKFKSRADYVLALRGETFNHPLVLF